MRELERIEPKSPATLPGESSGLATVPPLAVIGAGRVGTAITRIARDAGLDVRLAGRETALDACRESQIALLCVPDSEIVAACETIAEAVPPLRLVGHTSGAGTLNRLAAAVARGASAFSLHPLQTIPDGNADLTDAPCAVSGTGLDALGAAIGLAERLGMRPFEVAESDRAAYHAAASIASNFLVTLEELAAGVLTRIGADNARELLTPLVTRTAANWAELGPAALTGPIARGDEATIESHLAALRELDPELAELYEQLAARTREVAADHDAEVRA
jgi:predicted short-subunit dehydrogenase-like oxidoreductase (DUF2520 family)